MGGKRRGPSGWRALAGRAEGSERRQLASQAWGPLPGSQQKPGEPGEGVGPWLFVPGLCYHNHLPTFPVWPPPMPFPPGLLGAVGLGLPGIQSGSSEGVGGCLSVLHPFPPRLGFRMGEVVPPENVITWHLCPSLLGDALTTGPASPSGDSRCEQGFHPALKIRLVLLAPTPPHPGHSSWPGLLNGALGSRGHEECCRAQSGPSWEAAALPTPDTSPGVLNTGNQMNHVGEDSAVEPVASAQHRTLPPRQTAMAAHPEPGNLLQVCSQTFGRRGM